MRDRVDEVIVRGQQPRRHELVAPETDEGQRRSDGERVAPASVFTWSLAIKEDANRGRDPEVEGAVEVVATNGEPLHAAGPRVPSLLVVEPHKFFELHDVDGVGARNRRTGAH